MTSDLDLFWRTTRKLGLPSRRRKGLPPLLFFTDPARTPHPEAIVRRLPRGSGVVYRSFGAPDALETGRRLARIASGRGVLMFVGADIGLAIAINAHGIHLPERLSRRSGVNSRLRGRFVLTAAAHGLRPALRARRLGLDAIVVSAIFPSQSPSAGPPLGPRRLAALVRSAKMPVYGLGGVNARTVKALTRTGVIGGAAVGGMS